MLLSRTTTSTDSCCCCCYTSISAQPASERLLLSVRPSTLSSFLIFYRARLLFPFYTDRHSVVDLHLPFQDHVGTCPPLLLIWYPRENKIRISRFRYGARNVDLGLFKANYILPSFLPSFLPSVHLLWFIDIIRMNSQPLAPNWMLVISVLALYLAAVEQPPRLLS